MLSLWGSLHRVGIASFSPRIVESRVWKRNRRNARICWAASSEEAPQASPNRPGEATTDFTPFTLVTYSNSLDAICQHAEEVLVAASREHCFHIWNKWDNLADFLDLIGEIFLEEKNPNKAIMLCYYRFERLPILQMLIELHKTEIQTPSFIRFESMTGMPLSGIVEFEEVTSERTRVKLRFEHAMPSQLRMVSVGRLGVESHMKTILEQNLATFKMLAEGDLAFSEEKYDQARVWREIEEMREAYEQSEWMSTNEDPFEINDGEDCMEDLDDLFIAADEDDEM